MTNKPKNGTALQEGIHNQIEQIMGIFGHSSDLSLRKIKIKNGKQQPVEAAMIYFEGMIDSQAVQNCMSSLLLVDLQQASPEHASVSVKEQLFYLQREALVVNQLFIAQDLSSITAYMLCGEVIFLLEGSAEAIALNVNDQQQRGISEPSTETIIRGPREGFIENIRTNTVLLRQRMKSEKLWIEQRTIGTITKTSIEILYLKGIAEESIVAEVRKRLDKIETDGILESSYIEEFIQDETYTPFPTVFNTERPDVVVAELLEGRVAILVDGTPFALVVPATFVHYFQAAEDYYHRADISTLIRILRFATFFIALLGPSVYIAITTFHHEMIPTPLLLSLSAQREGVPFPAFIEAALMEIAFEILREAGIRMPRAVGQAVSIVGTLVIGTAAVDAGIVSAAMVIVVSITAISSFVFPAPEMSSTIRMIRFPMMILAATFGLFGIIIGIVIIVFHITSLRSFGQPYLAPLGPIVISDLKDTLIRVPNWFMKSRPAMLNKKNKTRQKTRKTLKNTK
ncbi:MULTISPECIES: spore germination protein [unclassified Paenibacillus]|uniref:spore germination protein n=1 Tax=unclassified Paenibacillus TaxID=185978 RepID=UPI002F3ED541